MIENILEKAANSKEIKITMVNLIKIEEAMEVEVGNNSNILMRRNLMLMEESKLEIISTRKTSVMIVSVSSH